MKIRTTDDFLRIYCGIVAFCHPSEVEESLNYLRMSKHIERSLDFVRHDNPSFFTIEIIGFLALDNHAIRS